MNRWELTKEFKFEAAHMLPNHDGKCARLHGHSWRMRVTLSGEKLFTEGAKTGMLRDFSDVKAVVQPIVDQFLDHHYLNDSTGMCDPTSENLAQWLYRVIQKRIPELSAVEVDETCTCRVRYTEGFETLLLPAKKEAT